MPKLKNPRHENFVQLYVANGQKAKEAYSKAYPNAGKASLDSWPARLIARPEIRSRVNELQDQQAERLAKRTTDYRARIVEEQAKLAFTNLEDFFEWRDGKWSIKDSQTIPSSSMAAIKSVSVDGDGRPVLEFYDRTKALHELADLFGMRQLPVAHGAGVQVQINMAGDPRADVMSIAQPAAASLDHEPTVQQTPTKQLGPPDNEDGWLSAYGGPRTTDS